MAGWSNLVEVLQKQADEVRDKLCRDEQGKAGKPKPASGARATYCAQLAELGTPPKNEASIASRIQAEIDAMADASSKYEKAQAAIVKNVKGFVGRYVV